ncbi:MAG: hypothetical protein K0M78_11640 [Brevundimonas sp.]|nr:hypothetical protein [Brevundimonas sp.]
MRWIPAAALLLTPATAFAQSQEFRDRPPQATGIEREWQIKAEPAFGFGSSEGVVEDSTTLIDESSFGAGLSWKVPIGERVSLKFAPELGYSPNRYDTDAPSSALNLTFRLQHSTPTSRAENTRGEVIELQDSRTWFVEYKAGATLEDLFDTVSSEAQTLGAGVVFSNIAKYLCGDGQTSSDDVTGGNTCDQKGGLTYTFTPGIDVTDSSDDGEDLTKPYLSGKVSWPAWGRQFSLETKGEGRFYDSARTVGGDLREDFRLAATLSVDLSDWLHCDNLPWTKSLEFGIGVRYLRKWSNIEENEGEEFLVIPSLGYRRNF